MFASGHSPSRNPKTKRPKKLYSPPKLTQYNHYQLFISPPEYVSIEVFFITSKPRYSASTKSSLSNSKTKPSSKKASTLYSTLSSKDITALRLHME